VENQTFPKKARKQETALLTEKQIEKEKDSTRQNKGKCNSFCTEGL
jgi:hypothetical protein